MSLNEITVDYLSLSAVTMACPFILLDYRAPLEIITIKQIKISGLSAAETHDYAHIFIYLLLHRRVARIARAIAYSKINSSGCLVVVCRMWLHCFNAVFFSSCYWFWCLLFGTSAAKLF